MFFQVHGVDEAEQPVLRRQVRRSEIEKFLARQPPTPIGIEACGASHSWARVLRGLGHEVVLMPPRCIQPYGESNDAQTSPPCLGPDPCNPSGPAVMPTAQRPDT
jgi:transposase